MKKTLLLAASLAAVTALLRSSFRQRDLPELQAVPELDLERYAGTWYEQARLPLVWQSRCSGNSMAQYSLRDDGMIDVLNSCEDGDGQRIEAHGVARLAGTHSHQGVAAISLMPGQLWRVTRLYIQRASVPTAKDTRDACMGSPKKRRKRLLMPACTGMHPPPTTARRSSRLFMLAPRAVYE